MEGEMRAKGGDHPKVLDTPSLRVHWAGLLLNVLHICPSAHFTRAEISSREAA